MVMGIFNVLILVTFFCIGVYAWFHQRDEIFTLFTMTLGTLLVVNLFWPLALFFTFFFFIPYLMKTTHTMMMICSLLPVIALSHFIFKFFITYTIPAPILILIALGSLIVISVWGILGIFEDHLLRFLWLSNLIQLSFVVTDLAVAKLAGKIEVLGTIQVFNYTIAGLLLFITIGVLSKNAKTKSISKLEGLYYADPKIAIFAIIAGLSLAGLPGLNIFVSEWYLFIASYGFSPVFTLLGIFAALILFILYLKIVYMLLVGRAHERIKQPWIITIITGLLAAACIIFGVLPGLQIAILT